MNHPLPSNTPSRPRFKVHAGLHLELSTGAASITATLSPDDALSLAMVLLYEAREQIARLAATQGAPR
jgi:hypothetical protein